MKARRLTNGGARSGVARAAFDCGLTHCRCADVELLAKITTKMTPQSGFLQRLIGRRPSPTLTRIRGSTSSHRGVSRAAPIRKDSTLANA